jgi:hypothetical protein
MSTSTPAEGEWTVQEVVDDPWILLDVTGQRLDADWTTVYPFVLLSGSVVLGLAISIDGAGEGPETVAAPAWAALLVEAVMPLATLFLYPAGLVAAYMVARLVFGEKQIDAFLAFAIVAGVATATKAASVMFGAMF